MSSLPDRLLPVAPAFDADDVLLRLSARQMAARIAEGTLRSRDLVEAVLGRIRRHDAQLSAMVEVTAHAARRQADALDRERARGVLRGPFHGVPTTVKDHHMMRFTRTRIGSRAFRWLWSPTDDGMVRRLRDAGFVLVGKTSMSELGILPIVETDLHPPTRNPWDTTRTAGGSSGGAGSGVGAGLFPLAQGSDGAGSVRIPSAFNGLVGLKPSRGLVLDDAPRVNVFGLATDGPMARCVDDACDLLDVMAGQPVGTTLAASAPPAPGLRIGVMLDAPFGDADPRILARVEEAARHLQAAGHRLVPRATPKMGPDGFMPLYQRFISKIPVVTPGALGPLAAWFRNEGRKVSDATAWETFRTFEALGAELACGVDVLLSPTVGVLPPRVHAWAHLPPREQFEAAATLGMYTALANVTGSPALNVPFGTIDGMPVGVQLAGHIGDDARLLGLARVLMER
jgi:amidase